MSNIPKGTYRLTHTNGKDFGLFINLQAVYDEIQRYLKEIGFKSYYYREIIIEEGYMRIDYGSHTQFFHVKDELSES